MREVGPGLRFDVVCFCASTLIESVTSFLCRVAWHSPTIPPLSGASGWKQALLIIVLDIRIFRPLPNISMTVANCIKAISTKAGIYELMPYRMLALYCRVACDVGPSVALMTPAYYTIGKTCESSAYRYQLFPGSRSRSGA